MKQIQIKARGQVNQKVKRAYVLFIVVVTLVTIGVILQISDVIYYWNRSSIVAGKSSLLAIWMIIAIANNWIIWELTKSLNEKDNALIAVLRAWTAYLGHKKFKKISIHLDGKKHKTHIRTTR